MNNHTHYVLSTMTASVSYTVYRHPEGKNGKPDLQNPVEVGKVTVRGGASLPSAKSGFGEVTEDHEGSPLWTPSGVVTPISTADYEALQAHPVFLRHQKAGLVKFVGQELMGNHAKIKSVSRDMDKDHLRQLDTKTHATRVKVVTASVKQATESHIL